MVRAKPKTEEDTPTLGHGAPPDAAHSRLIGLPWRQLVEGDGVAERHNEQSSVACIANNHASLDPDQPFADNAVSHQFACALDSLAVGSFEIMEESAIRIADQLIAIPNMQKEKGHDPSPIRFGANIPNDGEA